MGLKGWLRKWWWEWVVIDGWRVLEMLDIMNRFIFNFRCFRVLRFFIKKVKDLIKFEVVIEDIFW